MAGFEDYTGELKIGLNVLMGYYAQHQAEMLDGDATVFETIDNAATGEMRTQVRSLLGAFLFSGDSIYKKVKVLSGGEKSRLALAKLLLLPSNLLVFDEPTNHLDMIAKDVLKDALLRYSGSLIIVSHDRDFLKGLTTKTVEFKNKKMIEYPGGIDEFLEKQEIISLRQLESNQKAVSSYNEEFPKPESSVKTARENQKAFHKEENKLKKQVKQCEEDIDKLEKRINELEILFSDPDFFSNIELMKEKQTEYNNLRNELASKVDEWEQLILQLEEFQTSKE
jgi:ATP-binding cassette, subfamily F, member 3